MYAGLTTADKGALLDAKEFGLTVIQLRDPLIVDIDIALAQIEEMESAEKPLTWNERINQMTAEEKAKYFSRATMLCPPNGNE